MTLLFGFDEAGLGPILGPLVVAGAALRVPDPWDAQVPWRALADAVAERPARGDARPVVCDSKLLHARRGVAGLGRTCGAFLAASSSAPPRLPATRKALFERLGAVAGVERYPWYAHGAWDLADLADAPALAQAFEAAGVGVAWLGARPLLAGQFNEAIDSGRNKSEVVLAHLGGVLREVLAAFPTEALRILIDKQGGRNRYLPWLTDLFPGQWFDTLAEGPAGSAYRLRRPGGDVTLSFRPKADRDGFCVALASILAKYLRERFMADLNAWFTARLPGLKPTAGYPQDGRRFLAEVEPILQAEGVEPADLIRQR